MINSQAKELWEDRVPQFEGKLKMLPFRMESLTQVPSVFKDLVDDMLTFLPFRRGIAFLTVDGRVIKTGESQRRPGVHIDGNYLYDGNGNWHNSGGVNGWKVGEDGPPVNTRLHKQSYQADTGGMLIISDYSASRGWIGQFEGLPGVGGDCSHIALNEPFQLKANKVYYGNSQFVHESLPVDKEVFRTLIRVTLPQDYPQCIV